MLFSNAQGFLALTTMMMTSSSVLGYGGNWLSSDDSCGTYEVLDNDDSCVGPGHFEPTSKFELCNRDAKCCSSTKFKIENSKIVLNDNVRVEDCEVLYIENENRWFGKDFPEDILASMTNLRRM
eukprot:Pgem_evm1s5815